MDDQAVDSLERYGRWLTMIPRDDVKKLQAKPAFRKFITAFQDLQDAQREIYQDQIIVNGRHNSTQQVNNVDDIQYARRALLSLQQLAPEDIILKIFEFIDCISLCRTSSTCHRFYVLARKSALQKTAKFADERTLQSSMKVLRSQEQFMGINVQNNYDALSNSYSTSSSPQQSRSSKSHYSYVKLPVLGLSGHVVVSVAGDSEYNGTYFCSDCSENGFVFTKPRFMDHYYASKDRPLRCIITKRFSGPNLVWYMSKQIYQYDSMGLPIGVEETFSYWCTMLSTDDINEREDGVSAYPPPTSVHQNHGRPAWRPLPGANANIHNTPPVVELYNI